MNLIQEIIILAPPFLFALTVHEFAHGYVAHHLGDPTASRLGRLSLNPMKHLDPVGVLCFFLIHIGWAKPVPVDSRYFKNPSQDLLWVALAGPGVNLLLALVSGLLVKVLMLFSGLFPAFIIMPIAQMVAASVWINIMLAVFNLLPIPPLDGSKVLAGMLPSDLANSFRRIEPYGFVILLVLFYTGFLSKVIVPIISFGQNLIIH